MKKFLFLLLPSLALAQPNQGGGPFPVPPSGSSSGGTNIVVVNGRNYSTINAGADAATNNGGLVFVYPGVYREHAWNRPNVNYLFYPGASNFWVCTNVTTADALGLVDDRLSGGTTNRIWGFGDFYFSSGTNIIAGCQGNTNALGGVVLTNGNTDIIFQGHNLYVDSWPTCDLVNNNGLNATTAGFYLSRGSRCEINLNELLNPGAAVSKNGTVSTTVGVYWEAGETYMNVEHLGAFSEYGIWPREASGQGNQNMWIRGQLCEGYIYADALTSNFKVWIDYLEIRVQSYFVGDAIQVINGGKYYIKADKISTTGLNGVGNCLYCGANVEVWANFQKMSAGLGQKWIKTIGGTNTISCLQFEESTNGMVTGFDLSAGKTIIEGGRAKTTAVGLNHSGGVTILKNINIDTSQSNKPPVLVGAANLSIYGSSLVVTNTTTNCITATGAQTVGVYWSAANKTNNSNITMSPAGGLTVDAGVQ